MHRILNTNVYHSSASFTLKFFFESCLTDGFQNHFIDKLVVRLLFETTLYLQTGRNDAAVGVRLRSAVRFVFGERLGNAAVAMCTTQRKRHTKTWRNEK